MTCKRDLYVKLYCLFETIPKRFKTYKLYYWFNRQEILQKAKNWYSKEKAAEYYLQNKEAIEEKSREHYKNLSQEEKDKVKEYQRRKYEEFVQYKKEALRK